MGPNKEQEQSFKQTAGACRFVWNWALKQRNDLWSVIKDLPLEARMEYRVTAFDQMKQLPFLKRQFPFLAEVPAECL